MIVEVLLSDRKWFKEIHFLKSCIQTKIKISMEENFIGTLIQEIFKILSNNNILNCLLQQNF